MAVGTSRCHMHSSEHKTIKFELHVNLMTWRAGESGAEAKKNVVLQDSVYKASEPSVGARIPQANKHRVPDNDGGTAFR